MKRRPTISPRSPAPALRRVSPVSGDLAVPVRSGSPRRHIETWLMLFAVTVAFVTSSFAQEQTISTATLLREMTDLTRMAEFPIPAYQCLQASSFDRAARSPAENWFANDDAGHFLRVEEREGREERVLMEAAGPGAVVRIWSANPAGTLRIYLDGADRPALVAPMTDLLGGKYPGLPRPIAGEYSKGWNLYFPIPYAKHCRITSDKGGFYYHVNYRAYDLDARVETFRQDQLLALAEEIGQVARRLENPVGPTSFSPASVEPFDMEVAPGDSVTESFDGPAAITGVLLRIRAGDVTSALRGLVVRIRFDDALCVETPLGDLFGSGPGLNRFATLPVGVTSDGRLYSRWFMPFRYKAEIELVNHTGETVGLTGELNLGEYRWTSQSMHFHARWRANFDVPTRPMIDWNYLEAKGRGVFAGAAFAIDNPVKEWWGEGDEKIYVDGESFPSHFGTGTEDYFGYAWCWPETFTHAYHAQSRCDGPGNYGRTSVNRFHILDRIPFEHSFTFDMELWHWNPHCSVNMAVTAYWYARPGSSDNFRSLRPSDLKVRPMPAYTPPKVAGALEGEELRILSSVGTAEPQHWSDLSGDLHLWWHAGMKPGDQLVLAFPAPTTGRYKIFGRFLQARDYGVHQLAVNGREAGAPMDFFHEQVTPTREVDLGDHDLSAGDNELKVSVVGANDNAVRAYMFGLDYLRLQRLN